VSRYLALAAVLLGAASTRTAAQTSIAQSVARAPDGVVRVQYASRAGACGDGRDMIGLGHAFSLDRSSRMAATGPLTNAGQARCELHFR